MPIIDLIQKFKEDTNNDNPRIVLDLGTGDGRNVFKTASKNPNYLVIGADPAPNFKEFQREINRKKLDNAFLIQESIETLNLPKETFDEIKVILPWGSLLKKIAEHDKDFYHTIANSLKKGGTFHVVFGFNTEHEKSETQRLALQNLEEKGEGFLKDSLSKIPLLKLALFQNLKKEDLSKFDTTWAKKLSFGQDRTYWEFELIKT